MVTPHFQPRDLSSYAALDSPPYQKVKEKECIVLRFLSEIFWVWSAIIPLLFPRITVKHTLSRFDWISWSNIITPLVTHSTILRKLKVLQDPSMGWSSPKNKNLNNNNNKLLILIKLDRQDVNKKHELHFWFRLHSLW